MQTFLKFVVSACATVCTFLIVPLVLLSPAYGDAILAPTTCTKCGCEKDANDPNALWECGSDQEAGCMTTCKCVVTSEGPPIVRKCARRD